MSEERLSWDKCFQFALTAYAVAVSGAVAAMQAWSRNLFWLNTVFLLSSILFLGMGLILTAMGIWRLPSVQRLRKELDRKRKRAKRLKGESKYLLVQGSIGRHEEGELKIYKQGDVVGLTPEQAAKYNRLKMIEGPLKLD